jgi:hypothetical protein
MALKIGLVKFSVAKSLCSFDRNPFKITKSKEIIFYFDDLNSENLSNDNNASSQERVSLTKYQNNISFIKY